MKSVLRVKWSMMLGLGCAVVVGLVVPSASWAQAAKPKKQAAPAGVEIEEITVTAQKREENIQEVPVSVTALTGEVLQRNGIQDVIALTEAVPNLFLSQKAPAGSAATYFTMRGLGPGFGAEPSVGFYIDGAYLEGGGNLDVQDLDRVEVLRGPQGTLYGYNTIGGAVNLITRKPAEERSISLTTEAGNYNTFNGRGTVNAPLVGKNGFFQSDAIGTLSLRETAGYRHHDGWFRNATPPNVPVPPASGGSDFNSLNRVYNMTALRWEPSTDVTVDYFFEYHRYRDSIPATQDTFVYPGSLLDGLFFDLKPYVRTNRVDAIGNNAVLMKDLNSLHRRADDGNHRMHILTGTWDLGEVGPIGKATLKSISSYRSYTVQSDMDLDGSPLHIADIANREDTQNWSQELQWVGTAPRLRYVLGAYYFGAYTSSTTQQVIFGGAANLPAKWLTKKKAYAPYGQFTWTPPILGDRLSITGGLRYTQEQVHIDKFYNIGDLTVWSASHGKAFGGTDALSPMGDISYQCTDEVMAYFRIARGFKGGMFNGSATTPESFAQSYRPEKVLSYEAGFKTQWFDNRLRLNADGFFTDYTDQQVGVTRGSLTTGLQPVVANAASAEIWGMEFEGLIIPVRGLEATISYSFVAPKYLEFLDQKFDANNNPVYDQNGNPVLIDVKDLRTFSQLPRHQLAVGLTYTAPPTSAGTFSAHLGTYWQDEVDFQGNNDTLGAQAMRGWAYALVNGRLQLGGVPLQKGSLDLAVFANNLFDRKYRAQGIDFGPALGLAGNNYGDPRTFGLQLTYNFSAS